MADRDTTSTPYRLSADAVCYFRYPDGDAPVVTVADYAELRTKGSGDAGYRDRIAVTDRYINGPFEWASSDPYGLGDDGALCIAASGGGWWIRQFAYSRSQPIELDWWQPTTSTVWTDILPRIRNEYGKTNFWVRTPASVPSGLLDKVTISANEVCFFGQATNFNFIQTAASVPGGSNANASLVINQFIYLELDYNVEFSGSGLYRNVLGPVTGDRSALQQPMISLDTTFADLCVINCKVTKPISNGFYLHGTPSDCVMRIGGTFTDAGFFSFTANLVKEMQWLDTCRFIESSGGTMGVNPDDPSVAALQYTRWREAAANAARKHTGTITAIGGYQVFGTTSGCADGIGSEASPLKIICIDGGSSLEHGVQDPISPFTNNGIGKFDGLQNGSNPVYIDYVFRGSCKMRQVMALESSPDSPGDIKTCANFHIRVVDETDSGFGPASIYARITNAIFDDNSGETPDSFIRDNTYYGSIPGLQVEDGPQHAQDVTITGAYYGWAQLLIQTAPYLRNSIFRQMSEFTANNLTISQTAVSLSHPAAGPICIYDCTSVVLTDLKCSANLGGKRLITIGYDGNYSQTYIPLEPCVINLINPQVTSGAVVDFGPDVPQNVRDSYTFQINGTTQTLPWAAP